MWSKTYSTTTNEITAKQIWDLYADVDNWKEWDSTVEDSTLLGKFEEGNYFILKPKGGPKVKIKLIEVKPFRKFIDETKFPLAIMYGEHIFESTENGLKITITMSVKGILSFLWVKLVAQDIVDSLPEDVENQIKSAKMYGSKK